MYKGFANGLNFKSEWWRSLNKEKGQLFYLKDTQHYTQNAALNVDLFQNIFCVSVKVNEELARGIVELEGAPNAEVCTLISEAEKSRYTITT